MKINLVLLTPNEEDITYLHYKNPCGTVRSPQQHSSWDSMCTSEIRSPSPELAIKITHFACLFITQFQYYMYTDDQLTQICVNCFLEEMIQPPVRLECGGTSNTYPMQSSFQIQHNTFKIDQLSTSYIIQLLDQISITNWNYFADSWNNWNVFRIFNSPRMSSHSVQLTEPCRL